MVKQQQVEPFIINADVAKIMVAIPVPGVNLQKNCIIVTKIKEIRSTIVMKRDCI